MKVTAKPGQMEVHIQDDEGHTLVQFTTYGARRIADEMKDAARIVDEANQEHWVLVLQDANHDDLGEMRVPSTVYGIAVAMQSKDHSVRAVRLANEGSEDEAYNFKGPGYALTEEIVRHAYLVKYTEYTGTLNDSEIEIY